MIGSFRQAVVAWLERSLEADVQVSLPGPRPGFAGRGLPPPLIETLLGHPDVRASRARRMLLVATGRGSVRLTAMAPLPEPHQLHFSAGHPARALAAFAAGSALLVAEPFATRERLAPGDEIAFRTPAGEVALPVAGIFSDYTTGHGLLYLSLSRYR
jgi:putative ABC transport system permease protein